jgi:hypothetical protein
MKQMQIIKADTLWDKYRIDSDGDTVTPVLVKYLPTAFDSIQPCDIALLEQGDTARAETFVGTIKPNVVVPIEPSLSDQCRDASDVLMFTFTVYAVLKLVYKVVFMPRLTSV